MRSIGPFLTASLCRPLPPRAPPVSSCRIYSPLHVTPRMAGLAQYGGSPLPEVGATNPSKNNSKSDEDDWTKRPPYSIRSPEEFGPVKWRGKCQCGQVTYQLSRDRPLKAKFCHCRGCQVMHGGFVGFIPETY